MSTRSLVVLFEDAQVLAVVKPAGLLTQRNLKGDPALEDDVRAYLDPGSPGQVYLGTVHRLDRPVSGVILWAKTHKAAKRLAGQFARRDVKKEYIGVCEDLRSEPGPIVTVWKNWLSPSSDTKGIVRILERGTPGAREAETVVFEQPGSIPGSTVRLRFLPVTGRTHQLRVQSATRGMPILGDSAYGSTRPFPAGIALHARILSFTHPTLFTPVELTAPYPEAWSIAGITPGSSG